MVVSLLIGHIQFFVFKVVYVYFENKKILFERHQKYMREIKENLTEVQHEQITSGRQMLTVQASQPQI